MALAPSLPAAHPAAGASCTLSVDELAKRLARCENLWWHLRFDGTVVIIVLSVLVA